MEKYRKKLVVIESVQITEKTLQYYKNPKAWKEDKLNLFKGCLELIDDYIPTPQKSR